MGHVTIVGASMGEVEEQLKSILKEEGSDCQYQEDTRNDVLRKAEKLEKDGWESYLNP